MVNTHEYAARQAKVAKLVDLMVRAKITHDEALLATPEEWATAAKAVGSRPPSEETIELVLMALEVYGNTTAGRGRRSVRKGNEVGHDERRNDGGRFREMCTG